MTTFDWTTAIAECCTHLAGLGNLPPPVAPVVNRASLPRQALAGNPADPCNNVAPVNGRLKSTARPAARSWRKLHIGIDGESGEIVAIELTKKESDDAARTDALLDQLTDPLASFTADGAYDLDRV